MWTKSNNKGLLHLELEDLKSTDELTDCKVLLQIWSSLLPGGELCTSISLASLSTSSSQSDTLRTAFLLNGFVQVNIVIIFKNFHHLDVTQTFVCIFNIEYFELFYTMFLLLANCRLLTCGLGSSTVPCSRIACSIGYR